MHKIAIIHFLPIELYPPTQNLLIELGKKMTHGNVVVFTTSHSVRTLREFRVGIDKIRIVRIGVSGQRMPVFIRYFTYLSFYFRTLWSLFKISPTGILYFETLSSFPALLYKRFINSSTKIFIHYHEYTSPAELKNGMRLVRWFSQFEKKVFPTASWVSHTNEFRMERFKDDLKGVNIQNAHILPNFPPRSWYVPPKKEIRLPVKIVYAGALSLSTMYTKTFAEWVIGQRGDVQWDIYTYNCTTDARVYLEALNCDWISLKQGVNYDEMPGILRNYDVGVILYNGHIPNYIYNAPNKFFEYLACGLAVWFPSIMTGSLPYVTSKTYPEVISVDFQNISELMVTQLIDRSESKEKALCFFCEHALEGFVNELIKNDQ